ncbi:MAG: hypothetical protein BGO95_01525 [Micrococcales bacterium 73-13]|nr:MAG: hypothetical protein BGO95_01525 [Micrococcales bacterium 73-13]
MSAVPPGWYPDPAGVPGQRWWDGVRWSEARAAAAPVRPPEPPRAPDGTSPHTVWIWLIVAGYGLQALLTVPFLVQFGHVYPSFVGSILGEAVRAPRGTMGPEIAGEVLRMTGGVLATVFVVVAVGWLLVAAGIVFAWLDWRELGRRGVVRPFHWAYAFFALVGGGALVYVIGRSVIVRRRTGSGWAPMWAMIAIMAAVFVGGLIWSVLLLGSVFESISTSMHSFESIASAALSVR